MTYEMNSGLKTHALAGIPEDQIAQHWRLRRHAERQGADGARGGGKPRQVRIASRT